MRASFTRHKETASESFNFPAALLLVAALGINGSARGAEPMFMVHPSTANWMPCIADNPQVCQFAPFRGDPQKEPSHRFVKAVAGFAFPKHWHISAEHLVVVSGTVVLAEDGREQNLGAGSYVYIPVRRVHWGSCPEECTFYLKIDGPDSFNLVEE